MTDVNQLITQHLDIWTSATEKKSSAGRGNGGAIRLYGINKLRDLILELAVRGSLVPQLKEDKSFELDRSKKNRAQVKYKYPQISPEEEPFHLPQNWRFIRFIDALDFSGGSQPPKSTFSTDPQNGYVQLIQIRDLGPNPQPVYVPIEMVSKFCTSDDIMIGRYGASVGKVFWGRDGAYNVALVKLANEQGAFAPGFLYLMMSSPLGQSLFLGISRSAQDGFNKGDIAPRVLPLPPLAEQHRIVAKVDELMGLCDALEAQAEDSLKAHQTLAETCLATLTNSQTPEDLTQNWTRIEAHFDTLFTTEESVKLLSETISSIAAQGRLVEQNPDDEPFGGVLDRIFVEKLHLSKQPGSRKKKALPRLDRSKAPFQIPSTWDWAQLDDVVDISGGITKGRKLADRKTTHLPYLRVANVQRGYLELDEIKDIEIPVEEITKYQLQDGDLLITEGGDWDKVGRTAIWRCELEEMSHQNHVFRARKLVAEQSEEWLETYLNSSFARAYFGGASKQTTNLASINMTQLRSCMIPMPPLEEQRRIVARIKELKAFSEELRQKISTAAVYQAKITEALTSQIH